VVSSTPRPHFTPGKDPVPILQVAGWTPGPVWTGGKSRPHRDSIPDHPARSQSLYLLSYTIKLTSQAMYVSRNTETRSCIHCCSGKAVSITYSDCVFLALCVRYACAVLYSYCHLWPVRLCNIFHYLINGTIYVGGGGVLESKTCVLIFSILCLKNFSF